MLAIFVSSLYPHQYRLMVSSFFMQTILIRSRMLDSSSLASLSAFSVSFMEHNVRMHEISLTALRIFHIKMSFKNQIKLMRKTERLSCKMHR